MDAQNFSSLVGNTPLVKPTALLAHLGLATEIYCKCEGFNPAGSVKDRIGLSMIESGEQLGAIKKDTVIIEATSGNTGIGLAFICAQRGYRLILAMPDSMSVERRALLRAMGAELVLTEAALGMQGAVNKAEELAATLPSAYIAGQFENPANPTAHYQHTAPEIWRTLDGKIDVFIATIGSGGTITGCGRFFKEKNPGIRIIGVEPAESPLLSLGKAGPHLIQGIGANFIPPVLDRSLLDEVITVKGGDAIAAAQLFGQKEGYLLGISSGAALSAAFAYAVRDEAKNQIIVTILPDRGERYISTKLFDFSDQA